MSALLDGVLAFFAIFAAFGALVAVYGICEVGYFYWRRSRGPDVLPEPNCRAVIRRRGWKVPF